jgi:16S rRNA (cytidine1402-2'-O)-methyltransferase
MRTTSLTGVLYVVSTPIGNPHDITLRALETFNKVALIVAENPQRTQALLAAYKVSTPITSYHNVKPDDKIPLFLQRLQEGQSVALVSDAGTPAIVDPGALLIQKALRRNIPVMSIPGPSAIVAALSISGLPSDAFVFVGPLARRRASLRAQLRALRPERRTLVCFESPARLAFTLRIMRAELGNRRIAVAYDLTTPREQWLRGSLAEIIPRLPPHTQEAHRELTLIIQGAPSKRRPPGPQHTRNTRARTIPTASE